MKTKELPSLKLTKEQPLLLQLLSLSLSLFKAINGMFFILFSSTDMYIEGLVHQSHLSRCYCSIKPRNPLSFLVFSLNCFKLFIAVNMVQKRLFTNEESYEVSSKHPRQMEFSNQLVSFLEFIPDGDTEQPPNIPGC